MASDPFSVPVPQQVYCDESGFTGNNLLDPGQPIFAYAAVAIDKQDADRIVLELREEIGRIDHEIKSTSLLSNPRGRVALANLVNKVGDRAIVCSFDKKLALACKFYEYAIEPALAHASSFFYEINFHKFIANVIYTYISSSEKNTQILLLAFQEMMRCGDSSVFHAMMTQHPDTHLIRPLRHILSCVRSYKSHIDQELESVSQMGSAGAWVLDLTSSSLFKILCELGKRYESMEVYCDQSKPLHANIEIFDSMIGRSHRSYLTLGDRREAISFNLLRKIETVASHTSSGIQIADCIAGLTTSLNKMDNSVVDELLFRITCPITVLPLHFDISFVNATKNDTLVNALMLQELSGRADLGLSPTDDIENMYSEFKEIIASRKIGRNDLCPCGSMAKYKKCCLI